VRPRTQKKLLDVAARLAAEQNTLLGLQNDLDGMRRELWDNPEQCEDVDSRVRAFAGHLASGGGPARLLKLDNG